MIADPEYVGEVQMLCPGTLLPHPTTISNDVQKIYLGISKVFQSYLVDSVSSAIHLVLDGLTAPLVACYLGIIAVCNGLSLFGLKESHTGKYLAQEIKNCLERFGILPKLFSLCMDNAGNCSKAATELQIMAPSFPAVEFELDDEGGESESDVEEAIIEESQEIAAALEEEGGDEAVGVHDAAVTGSMRQQAIQIMKVEHDVVIDPETEKAALSIIPRVSGFARRINDSPTLKESFDQLVKIDPNLAGTTQRLARRVPTRWNSDLACLCSHLVFKQVVVSMTGRSELSSYHLSPLQWDLLRDLIDVLQNMQLFERLTELFSRPDVPLIVEVYPMLLKLEKSLTALCDDTLPAPADDESGDDDNLNTDPVFCVAAQASLLMIEKYRELLDECEIYAIAIAMCPDQ
ncbi:hypothetical protein H1R20_g8111, partial [Candolleomyces eurysporus]